MSGGETDAIVRWSEVREGDQVLWEENLWTVEKAEAHPVFPGDRPVVNLNLRGLPRYLSRFGDDLTAVRRATP